MSNLCRYKFLFPLHKNCGRNSLPSQEACETDPKLTSMCSASHPSSRARVEAILSAKHFLPSNELPPYPLPKDLISFLLGKWAMVIFSGLQGHRSSSWPCARGFPTECRHLMNSSFPSVSRMFFPMRVMMRMLAATYAESVSWIPILDNGDPTGPMLNGMTNMVLPGTEKTH